MRHLLVFLTLFIFSKALYATNPYDGSALSEDVTANLTLMISPRPNIESFFDESVDAYSNRGLAHTCVVQLNDFYKGLGGIFFELNSKARETRADVFDEVSSFNAFQHFLKDRVYEAIESTPFHPYNFNRYPQAFDGPMDPIPGRGMAFLNSLNIPQSLKDILTPIATQPDPFTMRVLHAFEIEFAEFQLNFPNEGSALNLYGSILRMSENLNQLQARIANEILR